MGVTYPAPAPSFNGDTLQIHRFLKDPGQVARRVRTLLDRRYIADALLKQRLQVVGGAITWESGDPIGTADAPRAVAPGAEYPLVSLTGGTPSVARTTKWGQDTEITDEAIARQKLQPVNTALRKLANQNVITVDSLTLSAVTTAITQTYAASALWAGATAEQILTDALRARATITSLGEGYDPDTVVLDDLTFASVKAKFIAAGYLPREDGQALSGSAFPQVEGMVWLNTPNAPANTVIIADTEQLGGMADEDLQSPGYAAAAEPGTTGVEVKVIRDDEDDKYRARARRVTVPVVLEPQAGIRITGAR